MSPATTTPPDQHDSQRLDAMWAQRCATLHKAWVQVRYHRRRQRFFDLIDKATKAITVVLGASLMGQYFGAYLPWLATAITSLGLLALVFGYGDRKQQHQQLSAQAAQLVADIEAVPVVGLDFERTARWAAAFAALVAQSPPPLKTLTLLCEREQASADGHPDHVAPPPWYRWVLAWVV